MVSCFTKMPRPDPYIPGKKKYLTQGQIDKIYLATHIVFAACGWQRRMPFDIHSNSNVWVSLAQYMLKWLAFLYVWTKLQPESIN